MGNGMDHMGWVRIRVRTDAPRMYVFMQLTPAAYGVSHV